jgi:hypothetical protein
METRIAWRLSGVLAVAVLVGSGACLWTWTKAFRVARDHGEGADLHQALLPVAPLQGADLGAASLRHAVLWKADLRNADLTSADLCGANLASADLSGARLGYANLVQVDLRRASLKGTAYGFGTRWPAGFDPRKSGAVLMMAGGDFRGQNWGAPFSWALPSFW